jgi:hypothetical protein
VALPDWGSEASIEQSRTYVTRLRQKLSPFKGVCEVVNEKGAGYRLVLQQPSLRMVQPNATRSRAFVRLSPTSVTDVSRLAGS